MAFFSPPNASADELFVSYLWPKLRKCKWLGMPEVFKWLASISTTLPSLSDYTGLCSVGMPALQISVGGGGRAKGTGGNVCSVAWRRLIHKSPLTFRPSPFMPAGRTLLYEASLQWVCLRSHRQSGAGEKRGCSRAECNLIQPIHELHKPGPGVLESHFHVMLS